MSRGDHHRRIEWICFDLDDTLHFYRHAAGHACEAVFDHLNNEFGCNRDSLKARYSVILKEAQSRSFTEGKASRELRGERFGKLMSEFSVIPHLHLDMALDTYDEALARHLKLKEGAEETLSAP